FRSTEPSNGVRQRFDAPHDLVERILWDTAHRLASSFEQVADRGSDSCPVDPVKESAPLFEEALDTRCGGRKELHTGDQSRVKELQETPQNLIDAVKSGLDDLHLAGAGDEVRDPIHHAGESRSESVHDALRSRDLVQLDDKPGKAAQNTVQSRVDVPEDLLQHRRPLDAGEELSHPVREANESLRDPVQAFLDDREQGLQVLEDWRQAVPPGGVEGVPQVLDLGGQRLSRVLNS